MVGIKIKNGLRDLTEKEATKFLKEALTYDEESGHFYWKHTRPSHHFSSDRRMESSNNRYGGKMAGSLTSGGYLKIKVNGFDYLSHRLAYLYMKGVWPKDQIDHLNGIKDDNSWRNLRDCSHSENNRNTSMQKNNTSGYTGVHFCKRDRVYIAQGSITVDGVRKSHRISSHKNIEDAMKARKEWEISEGNFTTRHGKKLDNQWVLA